MASNDSAHVERYYSGINRKLMGAREMARLQAYSVTTIPQVWSRLAGVVKLDTVTMEQTYHPAISGITAAFNATMATIGEGVSEDAPISFGEFRKRSNASGATLPSMLKEHAPMLDEAAYAPLEKLYDLMMARLQFTMAQPMRDESRRKGA